MAVKIYLFVLAFLFSVFGLYQLLTGKQTVLSKKILQKYNLSHDFIKKHGMLCVLIGCITFGIMLFYSISDNIYILYVGIIILEISYCIESFLVIKNQKNIDGIRYRAVGKACLLILFTTVFVAYFRPVSLSDLLKQAETIQVSVQELGVNSSGTAYIDESDRDVLSSQEKEDVITAARQYSYYRNLSSLLKYDGSKNGSPDKVVMLYVEENSQIKTICITSMQEIIIDNHCYTMADSREFIEDLKSIRGYIAEDNAEYAAKP